MAGPRERGCGVSECGAQDLVASSKDYVSGLAHLSAFRLRLNL